MREMDTSGYGGDMFNDLIFRCSQCCGEVVRTRDPGSPRLAKYVCLKCGSVMWENAHPRIVVIQMPKVKANPK